MNRKVTPMILAGGIVAQSGSLGHTQDISARLNGFEEVGGLGAGETGAILSDGKGKLSLDVDKKAHLLGFKLGRATGPHPFRQASCGRWDHGLALPVGSKTEPDCGNPNLPSEWRYGDGYAHCSQCNRPDAAERDCWRL